MVSLLTLGIVMKFTLYPKEGMESEKGIGIVAALICAGLIGWAVVNSKKETPGLMDETTE